MQLLATRRRRHGHAHNPTPHREALPTPGAREHALPQTSRSYRPPSSRSTPAAALPRGWSASCSSRSRAARWRRPSNAATGSSCTPTDDPSAATSSCSAARSAAPGRAITRVVASAGDHVTYSDRSITVNGVTRAIGEAPRRGLDGSLTVPRRSMFVLGDQSRVPIASRSVGVLPVAEALGKIVMILT